MDPTGQSRRREIWDRFCGKGRKKVGWRESARNTLFSSILNVLLIFIPFAWAAHFEKEEGTWVDDKVVFSLCFLAIIPLERLFEFGGEQMALYTGKDLGDLIIVTLNNAVEAALAIILLVRCELRILQSTIIGVVLLHLLLVPGTGFLTGGMGVYQQSLHPHYTQLNLTLLAVGVLSLLIPAAFFAALDNSTTAEAALEGQNSIDNFLKMSHGLAVILLTIYCASRIFLHNPPGDHNAFLPTDSAPKELHRHERHLLRTEPEVNPWFCALFLIATIVIMAITAVMLVESIEHVREDGKITEEWFGLILLPIVSFSADGAIAVLYFFRKMLFLKPESPKALAEGRQIELSIQFVLFWMPFLVLLAWWTNRPLLLLFDMYEVAVLLGACFLVNYITADSKTNWAEGYVMIAFYIMIAMCTWFYTGQGAIAAMLEGCHASLAEVEGDPLGEAVKMVEEAVSTVMEDVTKRTVAVKW
ncbi:uncharacterized protein FOMMEDRAFT_91401 [Fomitiporia mediterranea MF3/22]|uniref:uncharacterized protein n=1 Tax=Fomitiporia mediterranea (strain MF3/22) TaxID=694068 RepID=UPI0004408580|nr:uncharacterized protein FOMMEDRAFT_91401 [Fomitiporia mediterranea MF3/22]EJD00396.1 hypothetical protein FOMMEDRAFT_91401 [Fomitiporia mediterranea MF3/22]